MSNSDVAIIYAFQRGYRLNEDGDLISPKGKALVSKVRKFKRKLGKSVHTQRYKVFSVYIPNYGTVTVLCHRLGAYQKFSKRVFEKGVLVRHLNGNSLDNSLSNLALGTVVDNRMDIPPEVRRRASLIASRQRRRFSDEIISQIRHDREAGMTYSQIGTKYQASKSTLSYLFNKASY